MRITGLFLLVLMGGLLAYGTLDFPAWGDPASPASSHVSPYYIENSIKDTSAPNIVTSVLADYRGYDTMFEAVVIFSASIICIFLLRSFKKDIPASRLFRHIPTGIILRIKKGGKAPENSDNFEWIDSEWIPYNLVIRTTFRLIMPFILTFGLYVIAHGHYSPGGGFQGGVILGAAIILSAIAINLRIAIKNVSEKLIVFLCGLGVFIYASVGTLSMLYKSNYLDYSALSTILGVGKVAARSHGILIVEIGVGITVMAVMAALYYNLASAGKQDEGL